MRLPRFNLPNFAQVCREMFLRDPLLNHPAMGGSGRIRLIPPRAYLDSELWEALELESSGRKTPRFSASSLLPANPGRRRSASLSSRKRRKTTGGGAALSPGTAGAQSAGGRPIDPALPEGIELGESGEVRNGFNGYAGVLSEQERDDARRTQEVPVTVEVSVFRVQLKKLLRMAAEISSLEQMVHFTNAYGLALLRIARVLEAEQKHSGESGGMQAELPDILKKVNEELEHELDQQLPLF